MEISAPCSEVKEEVCVLFIQTQYVTLPNLLHFDSLAAETQSLVLGSPKVGSKGHLNGQLSEKMHNIHSEYLQTR
jgi:hypothetical protein